MKYGNAILSLLAVLSMGITACNVQVDRNSDSEGKDVRIRTPLGGMHVQTDRTDASDIGLPVYPGAHISDDDHDNSANVDMRFGSWQMRVKVANYQSPDPQEKVIAFYRQALNAYGDVIECKGDDSLGTPTITKEGLSCNDSGHVRERVRVGEKGLELKAGSKRHQHIVAFRNDREPGSDYVLIALDLPNDTGDSN
jgi:hypothetical protein